MDTASEPPADAQPFRADIFSLVQEGIEAHWSSDRVLADLHSMHLFPELSARSERITSNCAATKPWWRCSPRWTARTPSGGWSRWRGLPEAWRRSGCWTPPARSSIGTLRNPTRIPRRPAAQIEIVTTTELELAEQARPAPAAASARKPAKPAKAADSQATAALCQEIAAKHAQLAELNYYQLLNVAPDCDAGAIKHAYHVAAKIYHPDTLARSGLDAETRAQANRVFGEISKAHATLSDPNRRIQYDEERRGGGARGSTPTGSRTRRPSTARARS